MNWQKLLFGALAGVVLAVGVDLDAWNKSHMAAEEKWEEDQKNGIIYPVPVTPFEWRTALPRWIAGAILGAASAAGIQ